MRKLRHREVKQPAQHHIFRLKKIIIFFFTVPFSNLWRDHWVSRTLKNILGFFQSVVFKLVHGTLEPSEAPPTIKYLCQAGMSLAPSGNICCLNLLGILDFNMAFCFQTKGRKSVPLSEVWGQQTFSVKGQMVNILGFAGYTISVTPTQFYYCSTKTAMDNM